MMALQKVNMSDLHKVNMSALQKVRALQKENMRVLQKVNMRALQKVNMREYLLQDACLVEVGGLAALEDLVLQVHGEGYHVADETGGRRYGYTGRAYGVRGAGTRG